MRPKSPSKRDIWIATRVHAIEKKAIDLAAEKAGISTSDYIRKCCLGKKIKARLSEEEQQLYKLLVGYRENFEKIKKWMKGKKDITDAVQALIKQMDKYITKLSHEKGTTQSS